MPIFQFIGAVIGGSMVMVFTSLLWPRITSEPRPEALTKIREITIETSVGQNLAAVLGVTDEAGITPTNVNDVVTTGANVAIDAVTKSAQHAVTTRLMETFIKQFNDLSEDEKATFRAQICAPIQE